MLTAHAESRIAARLNATEAAVARARLLKACEEHPSGRGAVRVLSLGQVRCSTDSSESNGDRVVGIVVDGRVDTVELRRSNQPFTKGALRVQWLDIYDI